MTDSLSASIGSFLFEPVPIHDGYLTIWNDLILAIQPNGTGYGPWVIYNTKGELLHNIQDDLLYTDEGNYDVSVSDISEGYTVVTYGRNKSKMLYSLQSVVDNGFPY